MNHVWPRANTLFKQIKKLGMIWNVKCFAYEWIKYLEGITVRSLEKQEKKQFFKKIRERVKPRTSLLPITEVEYSALIDGYPFFLGTYYRDRWAYFERAIFLAQKESPKKILEIGPRYMPLFPSADTLDIAAGIPNLTYRQDATRIPWPIEDKKYDLVIALQVWEHLQGKQKEAFSELRRISKGALLSFPYRWNKPGNQHHMIDEAVIAEWTLKYPPCHVERVDSRILYQFRF